ncbi:MAG: hypothetical protein M3389_02360, partial [Actinomycetota bacterium]|nr:hypothetical protein [Actinomycetota bacterium]
RGGETRLTYGAGYLAKLAGATPAVDALSDVRAEVVRQRDLRLRRYTYAKAASGAPAQWETKASDARSETTVYHTDHRGRTLQLTDPRATVSKLRWDGDNNVTQMTEAAATADEAITTMAYNEHGQLRWISDPMENRTELSYMVGEGVHLADVETRGEFVSDLNRIEHPKGVATGAVDDFTELFEVDPRGNVTGRRDQEGNWAHTEFDSFGRVVRETDQMGNVTRYEQYDANGMPRVVLDAKDGRSEYRFDDAGNLLATSDPRAAEYGGLRDAQHRFQARFEYDAHDQMVKEILPKDSRAGEFITRSYDYDVNGNEQRSVDGTGAATTQEFDEMDRPVAVKSPSVAHAGEEQPSQEITRRAYDGEGNVVREQRPRGDEDQSSDQDFSTDYEYDADGNLVVVRRHDVKGEQRTTLVTSMGYDRRGNLTGIADPKKNASTGDTPLQNVADGDVRFRYEYDKANRKVKQIEDPAGLWLSTAYTYDRNDNLVEVRDPRYNTSRREYDQRDLLVAEVDQLYRRTEYERRADGKVDSRLSPRHFDEWSEDDEHREKLIYDGLGNIVERRLPRWRHGVDP